MHGMNLLVTGGAGFIGSHFVLRHAGANPRDALVVLDKMTYAAKREYLAPVEKSITFVQGDIADIETVARIVHDRAIDAIVNFAAESHVDRSIESAVPFLHTNVLGVQSLIEVCRAAKTVRLLHVSTDEVYGDVPDGAAPRTVEDALCPSSPYAASKAAGEMLVLSAIRTYGLRACITRCTNNYGPHQAGEKFIPTVIRSALKDEPIPLYGDGKNKRDWLYVTDHCDALERILQEATLFQPPGAGAKGRRCCDHVMNIAAGDERENITVAKMILNILGKPESLLSFVPDRPGHDWRYAIGDVPLRMLGWKPSVHFDDGLRATVEWYRGMWESALAKGC
ncbi:MAG: dTDP-glucose 4,6-dehydratase [Candidatus Peregrinibacteria bacterium Gr01-1014_25]|nr:MAG: dTDP-glucose 4,6-dehydratase [Candidatus Peregrinibacteria bacterium Gr01-1014_25]